MDEAEKMAFGTIVHKWFQKDDERQKMVQYAFKLGWLDFVKLIECENGNWDIKAIGDDGHAFGLCQMNDLYHKVSDEYKNSRQVQIEYCYQKWTWGTKFYWPSRIVKGQRCSDYVANRFIVEW